MAKRPAIGQRYGFRRIQTYLVFHIKILKLPVTPCLLEGQLLTRYYESGEVRGEN